VQPETRRKPAPDTPSLAGGLLAKRELQVLRHVSGLLNDAEVAIEMSIAIHAVRTAPQGHLLQLAAATAAKRSAGPASSG
jgi:hypothetical protein